MEVLERQMGRLEGLAAAAVQLLLGLEQAAQEFRVKVMQVGMVAQMGPPFVPEAAVVARQQLGEITQQAQGAMAVQELRPQLQEHQ
jgi:hypothetical protein